jgi:hypothetical protein
MNTVRNLLLALFLIQPLTGCALSGGPVEGRVLDYKTGEPIPEAIVVARWLATIWGPVRGRACTWKPRFRMARGNTGLHLGSGHPPP